MSKAVWSSVKTQHLKPFSDRQMNTLWRSAVGRRISQTKLPRSPCSSMLTRHVFIYQFSGIAPLAAQPPATSHKEPAGGQEDRTNGHRVGGRGRGQDKDFTCLTRTQVNTASQHDLRLYAKCNANTGKRRCLCVCVCMYSYPCMPKHVCASTEKGSACPVIMLLWRHWQVAVRMVVSVFMNSGVSSLHSSLCCHL